MSIADEIKIHVQAKRLFQILPVIPGDPVMRTLLVVESINNLIEGPWANASIERRANRLRADLEMFVQGKLIAVSLTPYQHKAAYMGLLDKPQHGDWDLRSRDPQPGLRVFGRFAETDTFVGLTWRPRSVAWQGQHPLGGGTSLEWQFAKADCHAEWKKLFPTHTPKLGGKLHDFLSDNAVLV